MPPLNGAGMLSRHSRSHGSKAVAGGPEDTARFGGYLLRHSSLDSCLSSRLFTAAPGKFTLLVSLPLGVHPLEVSGAGSGRERGSDIGAPLGVPSGGASPAPTAASGNSHCWSACRLGSPPEQGRWWRRMGRWL